MCVYTFYIMPYEKLLYYLVNTTLKELLVRLLKRWKSSANEERLQQYLVKVFNFFFTWLTLFNLADVLRPK